MARILVVLAALGVAVAVAAAVWPAGSQAAPATPTQRTFVSTSGDDANPCSRLEPCRNFVAALPNTLPGGEVVALDSGGYGPFTVDKSITVAGAPGAHVAVTAFSGNAITVSANAASQDRIILRNLYLTGIGGVHGIAFEGTGGTLHVENVVATGFAGNGLQVTSGNLEVIVSGSRFRHNGASGILVDGASWVEIADTRADRNGVDGFRFLGDATGSVRRSAATRNTVNGFRVENSRIAIADSLAGSNGGSGVAVVASSMSARAHLTACVLSFNTNSGLLTFGGFGPLALIAGSTVTGSGFGLQAATGVIETYGDNLIRNNAFATGGVVNLVGKT